MIVNYDSPVPAFDALIVLGRGIEMDGTLSETSQQRAEMAAYLAHVAQPKVVVFSGGHSWKQENAGLKPPSEGGAMLREANRATGRNGFSLPDGVEFVAEWSSKSTAENFVNSAQYLELFGLKKTEVLATLTDPLHNMYGRVKLLGELAYPDNPLLQLELDETAKALPTDEAIAEEKLNSFVTRIAMVGVQKGNHESMMRRQHSLEFVNRVKQRIVR